MSPTRCRSIAAALLCGGLPFFLSGCVVPPGGYVQPPQPGFDLGYYQPAQVQYGGWGQGYDVGPARGGGYYQQPRRGAFPPHAWRSPPASRRMPLAPWDQRQTSGGGQ